MISLYPVYTYDIDSARYVHAGYSNDPALAPEPDGDCEECGCRIVGGSGLCLACEEWADRGAA